ncbi:hypothetical protein FGE12_13125 [Aggregicoccus sp. 17bor-14]|uniref:hypothetical protein n=1 Tax=Myxococcaceae TaxID=31 RepID=UPI00129CA70C|nr:MULTISPECIES: hypothetical protein [Myxococcaceae]MBF5043333.1 hypothetical protein [Simulacricoccus sp. 17bor-14]MRI89092.1 hypothetical protein [Aggregicoccus sp. 17bor-14]
MALSRVSTVLLLIALAAAPGCRTHLSPEDARQLSGAPAIGYTLLKEKPGRMDILLPRGASMETMLESFTAAAITAGDFVRSSELPAAEAEDWYRPAAPPEKGPLFDPANVLAASLLRRMVAQHLAQPAPPACTGAQPCTGATLVLEAGLGEIRTALGGQPLRIALKGLEGEARLKTPEGRTVWNARCEVKSVQLPPVRIESRTHATQLLYDAAAQQCGQQLFEQLRAALSEP